MRTGRGCAPRRARRCARTSSPGSNGRPAIGSKTLTSSRFPKATRFSEQVWSRIQATPVDASWRNLTPLVYVGLSALADRMGDANLYLSAATTYLTGMANVPAPPLLHHLDVFWMPEDEDLAHQLGRSTWPLDRMERPLDRASNVGMDSRRPERPRLTDISGDTPEHWRTRVASRVVTAQSDFALMMRHEIAPGLRRIGLRGSGNSFVIPSDTYWALVGFQKNRYSDRDEVLFTINLKVVSHRVWDAMREFSPWRSERPSANEALSIYPDVWDRRIGHLLPVADDYWWNYEQANRPPDWLRRCSRP